MLSIHAVLYITAVVFFIIAGCPTGSRFGFQWFAFAALTLTLIV
jgi:hypothetical protein